MKLFSCPACAQVLYFENAVCERCGQAVGYDPLTDEMVALEPDHGLWRRAGTYSDGPPRLSFCRNYEFAACNWLIEADAASAYCIACQHNVTVPNTSNAENLSKWQAMERAKRRLFYTLLHLHLPLFTRSENPEGLGFEFLIDNVDGQRVMTGHESGLITVDVAEADDAERVRRRQALGEPYRTLLGHFRHEVGHWYWDRLVRDAGEGSLEQFRALFGDERADYAAALKTHYHAGPPAGWQASFISSYAASHPWEDFAESWAHYLHIVDTLETGHSWDVSLRPRVANGGLLEANVDFDVYAPDLDFNRIANAWHAFSGALNSFNRSMGLDDLYPFVLSPMVLQKLAFIHQLVRA